MVPKALDQTMHIAPPYIAVATDSARDVTHAYKHGAELAAVFMEHQHCEQEQAQKFHEVQDVYHSAGVLVRLYSTQLTEDMLCLHVV
jgi:hypothetical protein